MVKLRDRLLNVACAFTMWSEGCGPHAAHTDSDGAVMTYRNGVATVHVVRLSTTTMTDLRSGDVQPMWTLELDRDSAVQLSSQASFRACETALNDGYRSCSLAIGRCMQLTVADGSHCITWPFERRIP